MHTMRLWLVGIMGGVVGGLLTIGALALLIAWNVYKAIAWVAGS